MELVKKRPSDEFMAQQGELQRQLNKMREMGLGEVVEHLDYLEGLLYQALDGQEARRTVGEIMDAIDALGPEAAQAQSGRQQGYVEGKAAALRWVLGVDWDENHWR